MTSNPPIRHALLSATALLAALALAGCSGGDSVTVAAPATTGSTAKQCAALKAALPATLQGRKLRGTTPESANTAAWGSPAITLRCGVGTAAVLDPHSPAYDLNADIEESGGVCWVSEQTAGGGFRFTTVRQQATVELSLPAAYAGGQSPVGLLAGAVLKTDPAVKDRPYACV